MTLTEGAAQKPASSPAPTPAAPAAPVRSPSSGWRRRYTVAVLATDALAMAAGWLVAERAVLGGFDVHVASQQRLGYTALGLVAVLGWVSALALTGCYDRRSLGVSTDEYRQVGRAVVRFATTVAVVAFATESNVSRGFLALAIGLVGLATLACRHGLRVWLHRQRLKGRFTKSVVVVGSARAAAALVRHLHESPVAEMRVLGVCVPDGPSSWSEPDVPVLGAPTDVWTAALAAGAETIAIADTVALSARAMQELAWHLEGHGIEVMVVPAITDVAGPRIKFRVASGLPLIYLDEPHLGFAARFVKGAFDRVTAAVALVVLAPVLMGITLMVRLTSRGPALFTQVRAGLQGRPFRMHKFRTMVADAEDRLAEVAHLNQHDGLLFKVRDDPRVTRVGRVLRRWSLDELPQLWNVLCGHMSIVGPRPPLPSEVERYDARVRRRLRVKPGLTGLWQVSGRSELSWEEGVRLDLDYIERWSLATDLVIIAKTAKAVALRRGAC